MNPRSAITLLLSLTGAALDIASASLIMKNNPGLLSWTAGLYLLGGVIAATGILSATSAGMKRMKVLGALMLAYGAAMLITGYFMYQAPVMEGGTLSSLGMFLVGLSMIASGFLMSLSPVGETAMMQPRGSVGRETFVISLVLVGLLGFGLGFYFESTSTHNGTSTMASSNPQIGSATNEQLTLDSFDFTNLTVLKMSVMNTGSSQLTISRVEFNGTDVTPGSFASCIVSQASSSNVPLAVPMAMQTECKLSFVVSGAKAGAAYPVRIITTSGVQFVFSLTAGGTSISM